MKSTLSVIIFIAFFCNIASGQTTDLGSWNIINAKYTIDNKWSLFGEAQLRSLKFYDDFHYYEYKGGFNYKVNKDLSISLGTGSYQTYKEGGDFVLPKNNNEFRIWPQIVLSQPIGIFKIEQRYRSEFRFTSNGYRNRFRYRLGISYPFGKKNNEFKPYQVSLSNELFFTNNEPYFERNRILLAFNYKPYKNTSLQVGYLHQFDYKINDETGRDFLVIGIYFDIFRDSATAPSNESEIKDN